MSTPNITSSLRLGLLALLIMAAMWVLVMRLWNLQVTNGDSANQKIADRTVRSRIPAPRGSIKDRSGITLAENRASFGIDLYLNDLWRGYRQMHKGKYPIYVYPTARYRKFVGTDPTTDLTPKHLDSAPRHPDPNWIYEPDIIEMVNASMTPILLSLGLDRPITEKEQEDIRKHFREDADLPYHYLTDLDFSTMSQFAERNLGVSGVVFTQCPVRQYTYGALAAHIMGYVGKPENKEEAVDEDTNTPYETVGRHGIEAYWDDLLQGHAGNKVQSVSSQGYVIQDQDHPTSINEPTMGDSIYLTLDAHIQYIVETSLRNAGVGRAAVVVMDPGNGDILSLASVPSYDPNNFIPQISSKTWKQLNEDPTAPMYNRALHRLAPGSTYKIMVALAGLNSGKVTTDTVIDCPAAIQIGDHLFHNSDNAPAGSMSLREAIKVSSDVFFYQWGNMCGIKAIDEMGAKVGFGQKWNILGDDEDAGILPTPEWFRAKRKYNWSNGQTANVSIGQGDVLCTPLQMATFLCAVANGGTVYYPRLFSRVVDSDGNWREDSRVTAPQRVFNTLGSKPEDLRTVQLGMRDVVEDGGTGTKAHVDGYEIAGKTGTAQAKIRIDGHLKADLKTWFYCFAPFDHPRYVVCVMVEGGTWGGTTAAPIAQQILTRIFKLEKGISEPLTYLQPAIGNFNGISEVDSPTAAAAPAASPTATPTGPMGDSDSDSTSPPSDNIPPPPLAPTSATRSGTKHAR